MIQPGFKLCFTLSLLVPLDAMCLLFILPSCGLNKRWFSVLFGSVQGVLAVQSEVCQGPEVLSALFHHECTRVIADRFIDAKDGQAFKTIIEKVCGSVYMSSTVCMCVCFVLSSNSPIGADHRGGSWNRSD